MSSGDSALLLLDVQSWILDTFARNDPSLVERLGAALGAAREHGTPVIFVMVAFRPGYPEVDDRNRTVSRSAANGDLREGDAMTAIDPRLAPIDGEVVVTKRRTSAFFGTDLEIILRARKIRRITLAGVATGGVVLSTVRAAADLDLAATVLADGCTDADAEVHAVLVQKVFPRQATVTTVAEWVSSLAVAPRSEA